MKCIVKCIYFLTLPGFNWHIVWTWFLLLGQLSICHYQRSCNTVSNIKVNPRNFTLDFCVNRMAVISKNGRNLSILHTNIFLFYPNSCKWSWILMKISSSKDMTIQSYHPVLGVQFKGSKFFTTSGSGYPSSYKLYP